MVYDAESLKKQEITYLIYENYDYCDLIILAEHLAIVFECV